MIAGGGSPVARLDSLIDVRVVMSSTTLWRSKSVACPWATIRPRYRTARRSATSKTSTRLWEITSTARPLSASRRMRSSTILVWATPRAAVGSSMITSLEFHITARATATDWRWPPDSDATGWRIDRTVVTERPASVAAAAFSISSSARNRPSWRRSLPRNMFWTMSRLSQRARSWNTVLMPSAVASFGVRKWTGRPSHRIWPPSAAWMPEIVLTKTDLPAPLSPRRAVTWAAGTSRFTPVSACTGPKFLSMPRRDSRAPGSTAPVPEPSDIYEIPADVHIAAKAPAQSVALSTNLSLTTVDAMFWVVTHTGVSNTDGTSTLGVAPVSFVVPFRSSAGGVWLARREIARAAAAWVSRKIGLYTDPHW